jgi:hypothetical protein
MNNPLFKLPKHFIDTDPKELGIPTNMEEELENGTYDADYQQRVFEREEEKYLDRLENNFL